MKRFLLFGIRLYQAWHSGRPTGCRFYPSCSVYAVQAIEEHGSIKGTRLAISRIFRCRPFGASGIDLVPGFSSQSAHKVGEPCN